METVVSVVVLVAVVAGVYFYVKRRKADKPEYTGVGGRPRPGVDQQEK